ncbi:hypothetical protein BJY52DRAFT_454926 [Lactarius psammicola]|nr:hypothetical protein BJY52DRAFT_454926 [Lactarius psammicola]
MSPLAVRFVQGIPKSLHDASAGLDAYTTFNFVKSLVSLACNDNRTAVFTTLQPRSKFATYFDQLVLL